MRKLLLGNKRHSRNIAKQEGKAKKSGGIVKIRRTSSTEKRNENGNEVLFDDGHALNGTCDNNIYDKVSVETFGLQRQGKVRKNNSGWRVMRNNSKEIQIKPRVDGNATRNEHGTPSINDSGSRQKDIFFKSLDENNTNEMSYKRENSRNKIVNRNSNFIGKNGGIHTGIKDNSMKKKLIDKLSPNGLVNYLGLLSKRELGRRSRAPLVNRTNSKSKSKVANKKNSDSKAECKLDTNITESDDKKTSDGILYGFNSVGKVKIRPRNYANLGLYTVKKLKSRVKTQAKTKIKTKSMPKNISANPSSGSAFEDSYGKINVNKIITKEGKVSYYSLTNSYIFSSYPSIPHDSDSDVEKCKESIETKCVDVPVAKKYDALPTKKGGSKVKQYFSKMRLYQSKTLNIFDMISFGKSHSPRSSSTAVKDKTNSGKNSIFRKYATIAFIQNVISKPVKIFRNTNANKLNERSRQLLERIKGKNKLKTTKNINKMSDYIIKQGILGSLNRSSEKCAYIKDSDSEPEQTKSLNDIPDCKIGQDMMNTSDKIEGKFIYIKNSDNGLVKKRTIEEILNTSNRYTGLLNRRKSNDIGIEAYDRSDIAEGWDCDTTTRKLSNNENGNKNKNANKSTSEGKSENQKENQKENESESESESKSESENKCENESEKEKEKKKERRNWFSQLKTNYTGIEDEDSGTVSGIRHISIPSRNPLLINQSLIKIKRNSHSNTKPTISQQGKYYTNLTSKTKNTLQQKHNQDVYTKSIEDIENHSNGLLLEEKKFTSESGVLTHPSSLPKQNLLLGITHNTEISGEQRVQILDSRDRAAGLMLTDENSLPSTKYSESNSILDRIKRLQIHGKEVFYGVGGVGSIDSSSLRFEPTENKIPSPESVMVYNVEIKDGSALGTPVTSTTVATTTAMPIVMPKTNVDSIQVSTNTEKPVNIEKSVDTQPTPGTSTSEETMSDSEMYTDVSSSGESSQEYMREVIAILKRDNENLVQINTEYNCKINELSTKLGVYNNEAQKHILTLRKIIKMFDDNNLPDPLDDDNTNLDTNEDSGCESTNGKGKGGKAQEKGSVELLHTLLRKLNSEIVPNNSNIMEIMEFERRLGQLQQKNVERIKRQLELVKKENNDLKKKGASETSLMLPPPRQKVSMPLLSSIGIQTPKVITYSKSHDQNKRDVVLQTSTDMVKIMDKEDYEIIVQGQQMLLEVNERLELENQRGSGGIHPHVGSI
ncbi:hypothetical protein AX774_g3717 [Zancudomyces culisetae]|uniref:Uncharacterized protein n=1 Tax=Zancudomyces culisetae TaxID=1213189 RepID=A0A1R1PPA9_ZANCU|nr:hypothetical protein AX774_g3717 [Zancudomyces culisetae]|eukprot:OMH82794.1 hypothetical protein AX774_g3717 [Zancudomyces culisetae]